MNFPSPTFSRQALMCLCVLLLTAFSKPSLAAHHSHYSRHSGGGLSTTFYDNDGLAANGRTYAENTRLYGATCASNRFRLGTVLQLPSRSGGYVRTVVCDRIGHGSDIDLNVQAARAIMGRRFRGVGRVTVRPTVVGHVSCLPTRRHHHHE